MQFSLHKSSLIPLISQHSLIQYLRLMHLLLTVAFFYAANTFQVGETFGNNNSHNSPNNRVQKTSQ